ncbi:MAG: hypothetical protein HY075_04065 [Deltaproteobacteria bacterium]|nr:hypothetical protein [Deltaproteobacteria bacterium]
MKSLLGTGVALLAGTSFAANFVGCGGSSGGSGNGNGSGGGGAASAPSGASGASAGGTVQNACTTNGTVATFDFNHGHMLNVTAQDVSAGTAKTYHIQGTADHDHLVQVTAQDFANLMSNQGITEVSSVNLGHQHTITVVCAQLMTDA